jgi:hypothetical protein
MYPAIAAVNNIPTASNGMEKVVLMEGQATPKRPSGIPRATNAIYARMITPILGYVFTFCIASKFMFPREQDNFFYGPTVCFAATAIEIFTFSG